VTLTRAFRIGQTEVTQGQWYSVMGNDVSYFTGDESLPVEQVSWHDAVAFCDKLTERERKAGKIKLTSAIDCRPKRSGSTPVVRERVGVVRRLARRLPAG
jgi:hypothetical protein